MLLARFDATIRLLHKGLLIHVAVQECANDIDVSMLVAMLGRQSEQKSYRFWWATGANVSSNSIPGRWEKPLMTRRALYLSTVPSSLDLVVHWMALRSYSSCRSSPGSTI